MNENNVKLYINKKEYKYIKYFIPGGEGIYHKKSLIFIDMTNCNYFFYDCKKIKQIIFSNFNINNVNNMSNMLEDVHHYHLYLIFQNGIQIILLIWLICLMDVHHYHLYLILMEYK